MTSGTRATRGHRRDRVTFPGMNNTSSTTTTGRLARIVVNRNMLDLNVRRGVALEPVFSIQRSGRRVEYGWGISIDGESRIRYTPEKPLHCGAHAYIETTAPVRATARSSASAARSTRIYIVRSRIEANRRTGSRLPVTRVVDCGGTEAEAFDVRIEGPCRLVYRPSLRTQGLPTIWIETAARVTPLDR